MNDEKHYAQESDTEEKPVSVGRILYDQRVAEGLHLDAIAQELFIDKRSLEAIENDDFHQLKGEVFVRGYTKSYAKFLGLDVDQIMAMLEPHIEYTRKNQHNKDIEFLDVKQKRKSQLDYSKAHFNLKDSKRSATWLYVIIGLLVALGVVIVLLQFVEPKETTTVQTLEVEIQTAEPEEENQIAIELPVPVVTEEEIAQPEVALEPITLPEPEINEDLKRIQFTISDSTWLELIDANQQKVISSLYAGGELIDIQVEVPARVIIGNVSSVQMEVDDATFDINTFARGNVARFTVR